MGNQSLEIGNGADLYPLDQRRFGRVGAGHIHRRKTLALGDRDHGQNSVGMPQAAIQRQFPQKYSRVLGQINLPGTEQNAYRDGQVVSRSRFFQVCPVPDLKTLVGHLVGESPIAPLESDGVIPEEMDGIPEGANLAHIKGQEHAKRALEVAAAGFHNLLFNGPPGSGKTMLARSLSSILPRMTPDEALDVTKIYSVSGALPADSPLILRRPFRAPHYTISNAGLVGGGRNLRPGEISLSHRGVLFLDELPEFNHTALESLRQPLEDKVVTISRVTGTVTYPASFMLVAARNPCMCGFYTHPRRECTCSPAAVTRYQKRISGPLMDRIDISVEVPPVEYDKLVDEAPAEDSALVRKRVERARELQRERFKRHGYLCNSEMGPGEVWKFCPLEEGAKSLLQAATTQLSLSARAFHRILKVARTISDLDNSGEIGVAHLAEALQYRSRGIS